MIVELIRENGKIKDLEMATLASRLNEIKGDIKIRTEIVREILHNCIDASANKIDIEVRYINHEKVDLLISCYGNNLKPFENIESIIKALLQVDISEKKNIHTKIGGKGRGAKILLAAKKLTIESINNGKINSIQINNANKQVEELYKYDKEKFVVNVLSDNDNSEYYESKITYNIEGIDTNNIKYFEHESLVKYLRFFTILSGIKNTKEIEEGLVVNVRGLVKGNSVEMAYKTNPDNESLTVENAFDKVKVFGLENDITFSCIKCSNGKIECINGNLSGDELLKKRLRDEEIEKLKTFFKDNECYIFRTQNKKLKDQMRLTKDDKDSEYFGIRTANEGVMINERLLNLSKSKISISGGNVFAQYWGYVNTSEISTTGDRNRIQGDQNYYKFKNDFSNNIMPLINAILDLTDKSDSYPKNDKPKLIKELESIDYNVIQGLWSELYFILQYPSKISGWVAHQMNEHQKKPHDFETDEYFYEIKSKQTNNYYSQDLINISSVEQLDDERSGYLRIYYLKKKAASSMLGMNIIDIIKTVSKKIDNNQLDNLFIGIERYLSINSFKEKYDKLDLINYTTKLDRFIAEYYIEYPVDKNFPCIRQKMLQDSCAILHENGYILNLALVNKTINFSPTPQTFNL